MPPTGAKSIPGKVGLGNTIDVGDFGLGGRQQKSARDSNVGEFFYDGYVAGNLYPDSVAGFTAGGPNSDLWAQLAISYGTAFRIFAAQRSSTGLIETTELFHDKRLPPATGLGVSQSWVDVTASRSAGPVYTNSTAKPIAVAVSMISAAAVGVPSGFSLYVNGAPVSGFTANSNGWGTTAFVIVQPGGTYTMGLNQATIQRWVELR